MKTDIPVGTAVKIKSHGKWEYSYVHRMLPETFAYIENDCGDFCLVSCSFKSVKGAIPCKWDKDGKTLRPITPTE